MPNEMLLRSREDASRIGDPNHKFGFGSYKTAFGLECVVPVPLARWPQPPGLLGL